MPIDFEKSESVATVKEDTTLPFNDDFSKKESFDVLNNDIYTKSVVPTTDDPETPAFTLRAVVLGVIFAVAISAANTIFSFRQNSFIVPSSLSILLSYPIGLFLSKVTPKRIGFGDFSILLNPGPFSIKEHILVWVITGSAGKLFFYF